MARIPENANVVKVIYTPINYDTFVITSKQKDGVYFSRINNQQGVVYKAKGTNSNIRSEGIRSEGIRSEGIRSGVHWKVLGERKPHTVEFITYDFFAVDDVVRKIMSYLDDFTLCKILALNKHTNKFMEDEIFWCNMMVKNYGKQTIKYKLQKESFLQQYKKFHRIDKSAQFTYNRNLLRSILKYKLIDVLAYYVYHAKEKKSNVKSLALMISSQMYLVFNEYTKSADSEDSDDCESSDDDETCKTIANLDSMTPDDILQLTIPLLKVIYDVVDPKKSYQYFDCGYALIFNYAIQNIRMDVMQWLIDQKGLDDVRTSDIGDFMMNDLPRKARDILDLVEKSLSAKKLQILKNYISAHEPPS